MASRKIQYASVSPLNEVVITAGLQIRLDIVAALLKKKHSTVALEDGYDSDSELRNIGKSIPSLQGLRPGGHVICMGIF